MNNKKMSYLESVHRDGKIWGIIVAVLILMFPVSLSVIFGKLPDFDALAKGLLATLPMYWAVGIVEIFTYVPMLGAGGAYLSFVTGNISNIKLPCAVDAMERAGVKAGTEEGEIISTISVAISTLVTTVILAIGVALLKPLEPVLQNPYLIPAFDAAFTALFGALAYKYFIKDLKLVPVPLIIAFILSYFLGQGTGITIPVCAIVAILVAYLLLKREQKKALQE